MAATTTISAPESGSLTDRLINQIRSSSNDRKPHKKCQLIEDYLSKTIYESDDDFGDEKRDFTAKLPQLLTLIFGAMPSPQKESSEIRSILESSDDVMYTLVHNYGGGSSDYPDEYRRHGMGIKELLRYNGTLLKILRYRGSSQERVLYPLRHYCQRVCDENLAIDRRQRLRFLNEIADIPGGAKGPRVSQEVLFYFFFAAYVDDAARLREKAQQEVGKTKTQKDRKRFYVGEHYLAIWSRYLQEMDLRNETELWFLKIVTELWLNNRSTDRVQLKALKYLVAHVSWKCNELLVAERGADSRSPILAYFRDRLQVYLHRFLIFKFDEMKTSTSSDFEDYKRYLVDLWLAYLKPSSTSTWRISEPHPMNMRGRRLYEIRSPDRKARFEEIMKERGTNYVLNVDILGAFLSLQAQSSFTNKASWNAALATIESVLWSFYYSNQVDNYQRETRLAVKLPLIGAVQWLPCCFQREHRDETPPEFNVRATKNLEDVLRRIDLISPHEAETILGTPKLDGCLPYPDKETVLAEVYKRHNVGAPHAEKAADLFEVAKQKTFVEVTTWTFLEFGNRQTMPRHTGVACEIGQWDEERYEEHFGEKPKYKLKLAPKFQHIAKALFVQLYNGVFLRHEIIQLWARVFDMRAGATAKSRAHFLISCVESVNFNLNVYHDRIDKIQRKGLSDPLHQKAVASIVILAILLLFLGKLNVLIMIAFGLFVFAVSAPCLVWLIEALLQQFESTTFYLYYRVEAALESLSERDSISDFKDEDPNLNEPPPIPDFLRVDKLVPVLTVNMMLCSLWTSQLFILCCSNLFDGISPVWMLGFKEIVPLWMLGLSVALLLVLVPAEIIEEDRHFRLLRTQEAGLSCRFFVQKLMDLDLFLNQKLSMLLKEWEVRIETRGLVSINKVKFLALLFVLDQKIFGPEWRRFLLLMSGYVGFAFVGHHPTSYSGRGRSGPAVIILASQIAYLILWLVIKILWAFISFIVSLLTG